ncbi:MAG TPA: UvrD-helicase domain-containing protein [Cytophagaceae bacterium]|jgi:DNA helicase-4|nr:UvrD-helicase domain-containing protein [Cytophagaceae bacterium]
MELSTLNDKQKEAVISEDKRLLVLAGAGSGKTKTLIQKILFLINEKQAKSSSILAITFTKNAANEMLDRVIISSDKDGNYERIISDKNINFKEKNDQREIYKQQSKLAQKLTIRTIHSLCYSILRDNGVKVFDNKFKLLTDDNLKYDNQFGNLQAEEKPKEILHKVLIEICKEPVYLLKFKRYIIDYYIDKIDIKKNPFPNRHDKDIRYTTLKGDKVRSKSERDIADWLYRHNIYYQYEPEVAVKNFLCKPDFFIEQANLYLEHISDLSINIDQKLAEYKKGGLVVELTHEDEMKDSALLNYVLDQKIYKRLTENFLTQPVLNYQEEFKFYMDKVNDFMVQVMRVISMIKSNDSQLDEIRKNANENKHERVKVFYELVLPLIDKYKEYCTYKSYLDFDDLIIKTIDLLQNHEDVRNRYQQSLRHVLVDEFQDVNHLQVKLLNLLLSEEAQLFCVGDDWQSIYGFRGSEVDYIVNFEKYFNSSKIIKLDINYRSTENIVGASNEVIKHNKFQIPKEIKAIRKSLDKIQVYRADGIEEDGVDFVIGKIKNYLAQGYHPEEILVLYRRSKMFYEYGKALKEEDIRVASKTIHASKGLEAKVVFILGLTEGSGGFPDVWMDDMIFRVVKDTPYDFLLEEERRLFYVAMTRAKEELYLITEKGNESSFIEEIPNEFSSFNQIIYSKSDNSDAICSKCNTQIKENYKYCPQCGKLL